MTPLPLNRRQFLRFGLAGFASPLLVPAATRADRHAPLPDFVGINIGSFGRHKQAPDSFQRIDPYDIPQMMREEWDVRVIDMLHSTLNTQDRAALEKFRARAERVGCVVSNLKINIRDPLGSDDVAAQRSGLDDYKSWIDVAAILGARWVRPLPGPAVPRWDTVVAGYQQLADHAAKRNITVLVENYGWIQKDPDVIPRLVGALDGRIAAQPDTLNWNDDRARLAGLTKAFPLAASCDFKVGDLGLNYEHPAFDLRRCFDIGWKAGFRGPWCIEHVARMDPKQPQDKAALLREMKWLVGQLRAWTKESRAP